MTRSDLKFTADDYRTLPETGPAYQLIDGDLVRTSPAPSFRHQRVLADLLAALRPFAKAKGLGEVVGAPVDVFLSARDVVQPDVLFVAAANRGRIADDGVHGAPDLVIEILSPSTRPLDLGAKKRLYARHGVVEYGTVDLERGTVSIYRLSHDTGAPERTLSAGSTLTSALLPGLDLPLADLLA